MRNMYRRTERINEQDVPESQHTIFIRGLPGNVTTSEIREFFEDSFGSCTFDFIKLSKDREKLHVAVRFESKTAARECMEKYRDGELFGYPVQLTWFRDIRRYLNHLSKQGINPQRRRFDDDRRRGGFNGRRNWGKSRSRSVSKSPLRRSRSRSHSRSASSARSSVEPNDANADTTKKVETEPTVVPQSFSPEPVRKSKKSKKERRKKRRHSTSYSRSPSPRNCDRNSDREEYSSRPPKLGGGVADAVSDMETSDGELPKSEHAFPNSNNGHDGQSVYVNASGGSVSSPKKMQIADLRSSTASLLQNTSFTVDLESNNLPRQNIRKDYFSQLAHNAEDAEQESRKGVFLPPNDGEFSDSTNRLKTGSIKQELLSKQVEQESAPPSFYRQPPSRHSEYGDAEAGGHHSVYDSVAAMVAPFDAGRQRHVVRNQTPPPSAIVQVEMERPVAATTAAVSTPTFAGAMSDFKTIQRSILQDVRYKPHETLEKEKVGNFRLSSLSTQKSLEEIRHEKMARLSSDLQDKVERKKVQLELSYRHDCETFGLMTRKLISKDRTLEDRLRLALLEIMKDLETEAMKNLDEYIDQMIFLSV